MSGDDLQSFNLVRTTVIKKHVLKKSFLIFNSSVHYSRLFIQKQEKLHALEVLDR